jgi:hypothetical protein
LSKCIYCLREGVEFTREHVILVAFGTFQPISFVLHNAVCTECNGDLGRSIDLVLSRDSMEALLRLKYGVKPATEAGDLPYRKVRMKIGQPGSWYGAIVEFQPDATGKAIEPAPVPQAAFCWKGSPEWDFVEEEKFDPASLGLYVGAIRGALEIRAIGPTTGDHERIVQKLRAAGINFRQQGLQMEPVTVDGTVLVEIQAAIDQMIFRAIAKIAFGYVAHEHGTDFVLQPDFDDIRNYIRYGTAPRWSEKMRVVTPVRQPILYDDLPQMRQTNGHLVTFDWSLGQMGFESQVSLFNTVTYRVRICPNYNGLWHPDMRRGHHFDVEARTVQPLFSSALLTHL